MGRRRRTDLHLPKRMYERRGKFYFDSPVTGKWEPLGDDFGAAMAKYGSMFQGEWRGRTIGDTIDRYRSTVTPLKKNEKTRAEEMAALTRLKGPFGGMLQDDLTQQHLYAYIDRRIDERPKFIELKRPAPVAAKHEIALLRLVLAKGIRWAAGTVNAAVAIEFDEAPKELRDVTQAEYDAVYVLADERMQIAMDLASNLGQRREDLLTLRWADLNDTAAPVTQGKTGAGLLIERTPGFNAALDRAWALKPDIPKVYVLRNRAGKRYTGDGFSANWQRLMTKAVKLGVIERRFKFKDLRAKAGQDKTDLEGLTAAQELLGHATPATTTKFYVGRVPPKRVKPVR